MITRRQADELGNWCERLSLGPSEANNPDGTVGGYIEESLLEASVIEMHQGETDQIAPLIAFMRDELKLGNSSTIVELALELKRAAKEDPYHGPGTLPLIFGCVFLSFFS